MKKKKKKIGWKEYVCKFSVICNIIDTSNIINIHKYLMKKRDIKWCLELLKNVYVLLASIVNASTHTKCMSLYNQKWEIQPALINLHPKEYHQQFTTIYWQLN